MEEVQEKFKDMDNLYRLMYFLLAFNKNSDLCDYIISLLNTSNDLVIKILDHEVKPPQQQFSPGAIAFHRHRIIQDVVRFNSLNVLKKLIAMISPKVFIQQAFINDDYNCNVLESGTSFFFSLKIVDFMLCL